MTEYNKNVIDSGGKAVNGLHLKTKVMDSMLKFMRLMMMAPDAATKKTIRDVAHHWFMRQLNREKIYCRAAERNKKYFGSETTSSY